MVLVTWSLQLHCDVIAFVHAKQNVCDLKNVPCKRVKLSVNGI
jgi:hypothetical protein